MTYEEKKDADDRELSAVRLAQAVLDANEVVDSHRKELLGIAVWKYTEARSTKYGLRYRTPAAMAAAPGSKVQHEHVRTKAAIVQDLMVGGTALVPLVLSTAVGCVVTKEEHSVLTALPKNVQGWARYSAAGLSIIDGLSGRQLDPTELDAVHGRVDLDQAQRLTRGGGARVCLLAACRVVEQETVAESVRLAARDADSAETWWMHRRLDQFGNDEELPDWAQLVGAFHEAGRRFRSAALREAAAVLEGVPGEGELDASTRVELADRMIAAAASDEVPVADPAAAPLARVAIMAADSTAVPRWSELLESAEGGRYAPLLREDDGGALEAMRRIAHLYGDPVLDLALIVYEKRSRHALLRRPPAAVVEWVLSRC